MRNLIFFLSLLSITTVNSQIWNIEWQQCYGGSDGDGAYGLEVLPNKNIIVFSSTSSTDGDISFNHGSDDFWLIETDTSGNIIWEKTYGGSSSEYSEKMIKSVDHGYVMFGMTFSNDGDITNFQGGADYWVAKTDSIGVLEWEKCLGGSIGDAGMQIRNTTDSGYICVGYICSSDGDITCFNGVYDAWIVKLSDKGEIEWNKCIGGYQMDYGLCIRQTNEGGYVMGGWTLAFDSALMICDLHSLHENDALVVKMDSAGNTEWQKCYGGSHSEGLVDIEQTMDNGYIFLASTNSNDGDVSGLHGPAGSEDNTDLWVVKLDIEGNIEWQRCLGGTFREYPSFIRIMNNGNFLVGSCTDSNDGDVSGHHSMLNGTPDIWLVKLSPEGDLLGQQCIGGIGTEITRDVFFINDNEFYLAAQTDTPDNSGDVNCDVFAPGSPLDAEVWILKLIDTTTGITANSEINNEIKVYPNPAGEYVVFQVSSSRFQVHGCQNESIIVISDIFGQRVAESNFKDERMVWDCREKDNGIYFYQIQTTEKTYSGKFLIIK
jgi:hypothetical protein